jgi:hypothetical protein
LNPDAEKIKRVSTELDLDFENMTKGDLNTLGRTER